MTVTDTVALILSFFLMIRGDSRGFMRSLTGPFSIIVTTAISILYFQTTKDVIISLLIGLVGPLLLNLFLKLLLKTWTRATNSDIKPDFLSRMGGAILTLMWGWVFIFLTLILLTVLPPWGETLKAINKDVTRSISYSMAKPFEETFFTAAKQSSSASGSESLGTDVKSLAEDPRFQTVLQDPEIQQEINAHDIAKLMSNPKMMDLVKQIMNDPAAMNKVMALYKNQASAQSADPSK